ncbi:MAG: carbohydrate kinase [Oscillospiraceae bacterium]|nr:carbohydrate kinase [Oscillospiraceae bacterium]
MKRYPLVTMGELLVDLTQVGVQENGVALLAANPGGAPANVAVAAARLGLKPAFIGRVGQDAFGDELRRVLEENGVDTTGLSSDPTVPTTLAVVTVNGAGERSFAFYRSPGADICLSAEDVPAPLLENAEIFHFGSVSLTAEPCKSAVLSAVQKAKEAGAIITYDPNYRPALWDSEARAITEMRAPLPLVDILKISDEEVLLVSGERDIEKGATALLNKGIALVLITLGAEGVFYATKEFCGRVAGFSVKVADTNGAGDTFFGAFLSRVSARGGMENLGQAELEEMLRFANAAAAVTTSRAGAIPAMPNLQDVKTMLQG